MTCVQHLTLFIQVNNSKPVYPDCLIKTAVDNTTHLQGQISDWNRRDWGSSEVDMMANV